MLKRMFVTTVTVVLALALFSLPGVQPASAQSLHRVTIGLPVDILPFAPVWVAEELGLFEEHGIDAQTIVLEGGGAVVQALVSGSIQFGVNDSGSVPIVRHQGVDMIAVQSNVNSMTMDFVLRNDVADRLGVSRDDPIEERLQALGGLTHGITSFGAATEVYGRFYLSLAGLDPDTGATMVAIGSGGPMVAALRSGQIDGFHLSPPIPQMVEHQGLGRIIISSSEGDVPYLDDFPYEVVLVMRRYTEQNPDVVRATLAAITEGNRIINDDPELAFEALQRHFSSVDKEVLRLAFEAIRAAVPRDGRLTASGFENLAFITEFAQTVPEVPDLSEGVAWTNEFLPDID